MNGWSYAWFVPIIMVLVWGFGMLWKLTLRPAWLRWRWELAQRRYGPQPDGYVEPGHCMWCGSSQSKHVYHDPAGNYDTFHCLECRGSWDKLINQGGFTFNVELPGQP